MKNRTNESGRSMVEMLGVLAVIGVLSVMGIAGYTQAMKSYRGNEIVNATSMLYMMGISANGGKGVTDDLTYTAAFGGSDPTGSSNMKYNTNGTITMTISDTDICKDVKNKLGDKVKEGTCEGDSSALTVALGEVKDDEQQKDDEPQGVKVWSSSEVESKQTELENSQHTCSVGADCDDLKDMYGNSAGDCWSSTGTCGCIWGASKVCIDGPAKGKCPDAGSLSCPCDECPTGSSCDGSSGACVQN